MAKARVQTRDTIARHLAMLATIPAGSWMDTTTICQRLEAAGHRVTQRQVQADLARYHAPGSPFPLECNAKTKPYSYQWRTAARFASVPAMDLQAAVALDLVDRYLGAVLPGATLDHLKPYFREARRRLAQASGDGTRVARWATKIVVVPDTPPLRPHRINPAVQRAVCEALLREQQLDVRYRPRDRPEATYQLSPLGMIYRGSTIILVCTKENDTPKAGEEPRTFMLHRMLSAKVVALPRNVPKGFDLEAYVASSAYAFNVGGEIRLRALVNADAIASIAEAGLSPDQKITRQDDGRYLVEATVAHTYALRAWILGFADRMVVLEPKELREEIARNLWEAARMYDSAALSGPVSRVVR
jgi:predicted DNA-binding transcriptional regulator YafY